MKKFLIPLGCIFLLLTQVPPLHAQKLFNQVIATSSANGYITSMTQDKQGYIWYGCRTWADGLGGLHRYSASGTISYFHDPKDSNSLAHNWVRALFTDSSGMIWIATPGNGMDRFDPFTHTFTHFRHDSKDPNSLSNDTVSAVLVDHSGNLWVGTFGGLDRLNPATGKFTHYIHTSNDPSSLSSNYVWMLYEDHEGTLWVSCGNPIPYKGYGLNHLNNTTGTFTHYFHDPANPQSLSNNFVFSMLEDSRGNFWVGTAGNGLQTLNKATGVFTHYIYDPAHPDRLSPLPPVKGGSFISFIKEDYTGAIWIGTSSQGINKYDPRTKKTTHYGTLTLNNRVLQDTLSGFDNSSTQVAFVSKDGLLWVSTHNGALYNVNPFRKNIPYYSTKQPYVNAFYQDKQKALWIATDGGLLYKPVQGKEKLYVHDPNNVNSPAITGISAMIADKIGNLWLGTYFPATSEQDKFNTLDKFDPSTGIFTHYTDSGKLNDRIFDFCFDDNGQFLWMATDRGLYKINTKTGVFVQHYTHNIKNSNSLNSNMVDYVAVYGNKLWAGTSGGLDLLNKKSGQWKHYLKSPSILGLYKDVAGILWAGTRNGLYRYQQQNDHFLLYADSASGLKPQNAENIQEDKYHNLWVSGNNAIYRISANRDTLRIYGSQYGVYLGISAGEINYKAKDGKLYMGNPYGYYAFYPDSLGIKIIPPTLNITGFQLADKEILPGRHSPLKVPIYEAKEINLNHTESSFSFNFEALHYATPGTVKYRYMLEGYDPIWHDIVEQNKAYFFNVSPGNYTFKVRAVNSNGAWSEKDIAVIIHPPWWTTWWAIVIFILILIGIIWAIVYYRSRQLQLKNKLLEEKVNHRTAQLTKSLEDLKSTQKQLIQSEKMASLGELTAGIAHEIQNPLNFVNNFSEVSMELAHELKEDVNKENIPVEEKENIKSIIDDLVLNQEKINFHGKRADAIVKSMLQHSRGSSGHREMTDINALADEYLRLSYHGLRAKDKSFNATMRTDFDETVGKLNVVPQDIGRVLLNLFNNAFYATSEKLKAESIKQNEESKMYKPTIWVSTKRIADDTSPFGRPGGAVEIRVKDNGTGVPASVIDKIFQPFFTTKPTGEGTGLGLSLSYDIIKAQGGEIKVNTKEGEGTEFIVKI